MKVKNSAMNNMAKLNSTQSKNKLDSFKKTSAGEGLGNAKATGNSAKIQLSERAKRMQQAREIASNNTIDHAKVERLQNLIDQGKYKVDASSIADKMVDNHLIFGE